MTRYSRISQMNPGRAIADNGAPGKCDVSVDDGLQINNADAIEASFSQLGEGPVPVVNQIRTY